MLEASPGFSGEVFLLPTARISNDDTKKADACVDFFNLLKDGLFNHKLSDHHCVSVVNNDKIDTLVDIADGDLR